MLRIKILIELRNECKFLLECVADMFEVRDGGSRCDNRNLASISIRTLPSVWCGALPRLLQEIFFSALRRSVRTERSYSVVRANLLYLSIHMSVIMFY